MVLRGTIESTLRSLLLVVVVVFHCRCLRVADVWYCRSSRQKFDYNQLMINHRMRSAFLHNKTSGDVKNLHRHPLHKLDLVHKRLEAVGFIHGNLAEHLAVQLDILV